MGNIELIAVMYLDGSNGWIDFQQEPKLIIPLTDKTFSNGRPPIDQTIEDLKTLLEKISLEHLSRRYGFLPLGKVEIEKGYEGKFSVYNSYFVFSPVI